MTVGESWLEIVWLLITLFNYYNTIFALLRGKREKESLNPFFCFSSSVAFCALLSSPPSFPSLHLILFFSTSCLTRHYCQILLLACVSLAWGLACSRLWQDLWQLVQPEGLYDWHYAGWAAPSPSMKGGGGLVVNRIDSEVTDSLGCEANVISALFFSPSTRISSKWLWFGGFLLQTNMCFFFCVCV